MPRHGLSLFRSGCLLAIVAIIGCGAPPSPKREFGDVKGKVSYKGQALKKGTVTFQPVTGTPVVGDIQADGTYSLKGVIGPNTVMIVSQDAGQGPTPEKREPTPPKEHIPAKYGTPGSGLKFDVKAGPNQADFDVK